MLSQRVHLLTHAHTTQDKLSSLGAHLWLQSAVASLADGEGGSFKRLCGGISPATLMWSLQLACAYHQSCLGQACRHLAAAHAGPGDVCSGAHAHAQLLLQHLARWVMGSASDVRARSPEA